MAVERGLSLPKRLMAAAVLLVSALVVGVAPPETALASGAGDITEVKFFASPNVWNPGDPAPVQDPADAVSSLGPVKDVSCGTVITFWTRIIMAPGTGAVDDVLEIDYGFGYDSTSDENVGLRNIVGLSIYSENGDGDADATEISEVVVPDPDIPGTVRLYTPTVEITGLDAGETVWVQTDVVVGCDLDTGATGTVQAQLTQATETSGPVDELLDGGALTIPGLSPKAPPDWTMSKTPYDSSGAEITGPVGPYETVTWVIEIENIGPSDLPAPAISDDTCSPLTGPTGDDNTDGLINASQLWTEATFELPPTMPAETWTWTCTQVLGDTTTTNVAVADFGRFKGDGPTTATSTVEVEPPNPDITVTKTADPAYFEVGDTVTWTVEVDNTGNVPFTTLAIVDPVCSPFALTPTDGTLGDVNGDTWLNASETWIYTCSSAALAATTPNTATVTGTDPDLGETGDTDSATTTLTGLEVTKSAAPNPIVYGQTTTWTIDVANDGDAAISDLVVTDDTCSPLSGPTGDAGAVGVLDVGETWQYTCASEALTADTTNTVDVEGKNPDGSPIDGTATAEVTVDIKADLSVTKTVSDDPISEGGTLTYTLVVANDGPAPATDVILSDPLPAGVSLTSATATNGGACDTAVICTWPALASGDSAEVTITVGVDDPFTAANPVENTATVSANEDDPDLDDNTASADSTVLLPSVDLVKVLAGPATLAADGSFDLTYTLTVTNDGNTAVEDLQAVDDLEAVFGAAPNTAVVSAVPGGANTCSANPAYDGATAGTTELLTGADTLAVGESCTITLTVNVTPDPAPGATGTTYENSAEASAIDELGTEVDDVSSDPTNGDGTTPVTLASNAEIGAAKAISGTPTIMPDGSIAVTYDLVVENSGDVTLTDVNVSDDLYATFGPASTFDAITITADGPCAGAENNAGYDAGAVDADLLTGGITLAPSQSCTITLGFEVVPGATEPGDNFPGSYDNTATASGTDPYEGPVSDDSTDGTEPDADGSGDPGDDDTPTSFEIAPDPELTTEKSIGTTPTIEPDGTISGTYVVTISNSGDVTLTGVQVVDDLNLTFGSGTTWESGSVTADSVCAASTHAGYTGVDAAPATSLVDPALADPGLTLEPGEVCEFTIAYVVDPGTGPALSPGVTTYTNTAASTASSPYGTGDVTSSDDATADVSYKAALEVGKSVNAATVTSDAELEISYAIELANSGDVDLTDVQIDDDLAATFGIDASSDITSGPTLSSTCFTTNPSFDGVGDIELLTAGNTLAAGDSCTITLTATVEIGEMSPLPTLGTDATFANIAEGVGTDPFSGLPVEDDGSGAVTIVGAQFTLVPTVTKTLAAGYPKVNPDGSFDIQYEIVAANAGTLDIANLSVTDDLVSAYGVGSVITQTDATPLVVGSSPCTANTDFDGDPAGDDELVAAGVSLPVGADCTMTVSFTVMPGADPAIAPASVTYDNKATVSGNAPGSPSTTASDDDEASAALSYGPELGVAKAVVGDPEINPDGSVALTYQITIENSGDVNLDPITVTDDLFATFGAASTFTNLSITADPAGPCDGSENNTFDGGTTNTNLLTATAALAAGESCVLTLDFNVTPGDTEPGDNFNTTYENTAYGTGTDPYDEPVEDTSTNGTDPDPDNDGPNNNNEPTPTSFTPLAQLGTAKDITDGPKLNPDGSITLTYSILIENTGDVTVSDIQIPENLETVFGTGSTVTVESLTATSPLTANDPAGSGSYDGLSAGDTNLLDGLGDLDPGESSTITLEVTVLPTTPLPGPFTNQVTATGTDPYDGPVEDTSTNGTDPDPDNDGPDNNNEPTSFEISANPELGVAKAVVGDPEINPDGSVALTYQITIENSGDVNLDPITVTDDLFATFGAASTFTNLAITADPAGPCDGSENNTFDGGTTNTNLLTATAALAAGESCVLTLDFNVTPGDTEPGDNFNTTYENTAYGTGTDPYDEPVEDTSTNGTDPDPDNDGPNNNNEPTPTSFTPLAQLGTAKDITDGPKLNPDGSITLTYSILIENTGDVTVSDIQIPENLETVFGTGSTVTVESLTATSPLTANDPAGSGSYDGLSAGDTNLLDGLGDLDPGESSTITLEVTVLPTTPLPGPFTNQVTATGTDPYDGPVEDTSTNGTDPDPDNDGPDNNNEPTSFEISANPELGVAKAVVGDPEINPDGSVALTYQITIENSGDVNLDPITVTDDLFATFGAASTFTNLAITADPAGPCDGSENNTFDGGTTNTNLLTATAALAAGESCVLTLDFNVTPGDTEPGDNFNTTYENTAYGTGTDPYDEPVEDTSTNGTDPDPDNDGPNNNNEPTPTSFTPLAQLGTAKDITDGPANNGDGSYTMTYRFTVVNSGALDVAGLQIMEDLEAVFGAGSTIVIEAITPSSPFTADTAYDGLTGGNVGLLSGGQVLAAGESMTVDLTVTITPGIVADAYENQATATGTDPYGNPVSDDSVTGADPDPDGDGDPTNDGGPTIVGLGSDPVLGLAKEATGPPTPEADGSFTVTYRFVVENLGDVNINALQVDDDLQAVFGLDAVITVDAVEADLPLLANPSYDGVNDIGLLTGTETLAVGQRAAIELTFNVQPGTLGEFENRAEATGTAPGGEPVTDDSADGDDVDPDGNGDPTDDDSPTVISLAVEPSIGVAKDIVGTPLLRSDGSYQVLFELLVTNSGPIALSEVQIADNLAAQWPGTDFAVVGISSSTLSVNPAYDGSGDVRLLQAVDTLQPGESGALNLVVDIIDGPAELDNSALGTGVTTTGQRVEDLSTAGSEIDPDNDGDPTTDSTSTTIEIRPPSDPGPGSLAFTGAGTWRLISIALGLLGFGFALLAISGRRRPRAA